MTNQNTAHSPLPAEAGPDRVVNTRSEAADGVSTNSVDPPQHPRKGRRRLSVSVAAVLLLAGIGQAAWPVIDFSAVAQLIEQVRIASDSLDEMTTAKRALLGEVAALTGVWDDLTGDAYGLSEKASSLVTNYSLTGIEDGLEDRMDAERNAWPSAADVEHAYAGQDAAVIEKVLGAYQSTTLQLNAERNAWYDAQIVIAQTGKFLESVETTAGTQNSTTDQGLSAQLDRHIAVSSTSRDIAAGQLEMAVSAEHRAARLDHLQAVERANRKRRALMIRTEIQDVLDDQESNFDSAAFDTGLYTPVLPTY